MALVVNDRYALHRLVGGGGMGRVYLATDLRERGHVIALKSIAAAPDDEPLVEHLSHEFLVLADLAHPSLVRVFDFDHVRHVVGEAEDDEPGEALPAGTSFFTREYVAGAGLLTATARLSHTVILRLMLELSGAVAYLHRQGLLHRDLKPDNILVTDLTSDQRSTHLKILDFGLACVQGEGTAAVGTLRYLAPELLLGAPTDTRAEMFALGLLMYEIFAGRGAFQGTSAAELARAHATQDPDPLPTGIPLPVRDLVLALLSRDPAQRPGATEVSRRLEHILAPEEPRGAAFWSALGATRLAGRRQELELLESALQALASGSSGGAETSIQAVLLTGSPGIGKTRLVQAVRHRAQVRGLRLLAATCQPNADAFSGGRALLLPLILERPDLVTPEREVLRTVLSDRPLAPIEHRSADLTPRQAMVRIFDAARALIEAAAQEQPLVLVMEDLHRADEESLELFRHLLLHLPPGVALLVGTSWPSSQAESPLDRLTAELPDAPVRVRWIELEGLDTSAVQLMVQRTLGLEDLPEPLVERLRDQTEGNPLFIEETLKLTRGVASLETLLEDHHLPTVVGEAFRQQILALSPTALNALKGLAVWGTSGTSSDIAEVTCQDRAACLEGLEEAAACQLIREQGTGYWFWHNLLVQLVEELMTPDEAAQHHLRAGRRREATGELHDPERIGRLVTHFTRAGDSARALGYAMTGARLAEERFLARRAIELYERARDLVLEGVGRSFGGTAGLIEIRERLARLYTWTGAYARAEAEANTLLDDPCVLADVPTRLRLRSQLGEIATRRGELEEALGRFKLALQDSRSPQSSAEILDRIAEVHIRRGHLEEARFVCRQALQELEDTPSPVLRASIAQHQGKCAQQQGDFPEALEHFARARSLYQRASYLPGVAGTMNAIAQIYHYQQKYALAREAFQDALELQERLGDVEGAAVTLDRLGLTTWGLMDIQAAILYVTRSIDAWRRLGSPQGEGKALSTLALLQYSRGAYGEALSCAEMAIVRQRKAGDETGLIVSFQNLGLYCYEIGALDEAQKAEETALELARRSGSRVREARCFQILGGIGMIRGDTPRAREHLERALEVFRQVNNIEQLADVLCGLVEVNLLERKLEEAGRCSAEALELVIPLGRQPILVQARIVQARVLLANPAADPRAMATELEAIGTLAGELGNPDLLWQVWEVRGRLALRSGRPSEAARFLTRSMELIHGCYLRLPDRLRAVYLSDPRRLIVRKSLQEAVTILRRDPRLNLPS